jgi:hypothetical protein
MVQQQQLLQQKPLLLSLLLQPGSLHSSSQGLRATSLGLCCSVAATCTMGGSCCSCSSRRPTSVSTCGVWGGDVPSQTRMVLPGVHAFHPALLLYDGVTWSALLDRCRLCLTQGGMAGLAAAGYPIQNAVQRANTAIAALHALKAAGNAAAPAAAYTAFAQQLQALGGVLSTLPVPHACNNPSCTNMLGATELAIVSRRSCTCKGCLTARYCERACQVAHWKQHRPVCKALAAASAEASGKQAVQC